MSFFHILPGSCYMVIRLDVNVANSKRLMFDNESQYVTVLFKQLLECMLGDLFMRHKRLASIRRFSHDSPCATARVPSQYRFSGMLEAGSKLDNHEYSPAQGM